MFAMTLVLGAINGFLIGYLRLNSLIVTLGMLSAIHGLTLTYSGGQNMDIANRARAPGSTSSGAAPRSAFPFRS
jgi:ribose transport system permease protein